MTGIHRATSSSPKRRAPVIALAGAVLLVLGCTALIVILTNGNPRRDGTTPVGAASHFAPTTFAPTSTNTPAAPSFVAAPSAVRTNAPTSASAVKPLTYTVKPGDNLAAIAAWFHLHGYGSLYDANKNLIGGNPRLIHPGQVITISARGMTVN